MNAALRVSDLLPRLATTLAARVGLSARERAVLEHLLFGRRDDAIATRLGLRVTTVHKHMHRIFAKTKTASRSELFDLALRQTVRAECFTAAPAPRAIAA